MPNIINNPILNDFIYTLLYESSIEEKRGLKAKYLKIALNGRLAKKFATTSTREEKEYILSHFGMEYFYIIAKRGMPLLKFREILNKFESKKKVAALKDISEEGVFVTSDKEFLRLLGLMSQSIGHHTYFLNLELNRQGYHIQKWKKNTVNKEDMLTREIDANAKMLVKTCLSTTLMMDYWPGITGISSVQMKVLLYLYTVSHTYVADEKLYGIFAGAITKNKYRVAAKQLFENQYIQKHVASNVREFTITGMGIKQVNEFVHKTLNLNTY